MDIHPQPMITKDNVEIMVDGIICVRPNLCQEIGDLTLDESLAARETIATNLQRVLNTCAVEWDLTVSKVEIRLINLPEDIKKAKHKKKTAEQERRSMRLMATDEFKAAEQHKLAILEHAEGEREAVIKAAQSRAETIRLVNKAAEKYFVGNAQTPKQIGLIENSLRKNEKIVITEHCISPILLLGSPRVRVVSEISGK